MALPWLLGSFKSGGFRVARDGVYTLDTIAQPVKFVPIRFTQEAPDCPIGTSVAEVANLVAMLKAR